MSQTRTNAEVAAVFQGIADLMTQKGDNQFKIRAYKNAVRTLGELPEPIADIAGRGKLKDIPGFGDAIASKTQEILATGTCELYERLLKEQSEEEPEREDEEAPPVAPVPAPADEEIPSPW